MTLKQENKGLLKLLHDDYSAQFLMGNKSSNEPKTAAVEQRKACKSKLTQERFPFS
jgi:hypothetical protein